MSGPGALPPEVAAMLGAGAGAAPGMPSMPGGPGAPGLDGTAGAEALAQSDVAKAGLEAWARVQALGGARPEASDLKALTMYVMVEGPQAPEAAAITDYLLAKGVKLPGTNSNGGEFDEPV